MFQQNFRLRLTGVENVELLHDVIVVEKLAVGAGAEGGEEADTALAEGEQLLGAPGERETGKRNVMVRIRCNMS